MIRASLLGLWGVMVASGVVADSYPTAKAVVSVGGPVTETIYALGQQDRLVGRDTTSVYPPEANHLPDVGYMRALSAEGVLSLSPDLILARSTSGPPETLDQLAASSVPIVLVEDKYSVAAVVTYVETIGAALGVPTKADALVAEIKDEFAALERDLAGRNRQKRVLFVLSIDGGRMNAAGANTGANGIIELAGGLNVFADDFNSYKPVDAEAVIQAAPDVIVMMEARGDHSTRKADIMGMPAVALTPAGQSGAFVTIPGAALGFGPRTAGFARQLHQALYSDAEG
jgi:iron complex transport system substrate-binding protein